MKTNNLVKNDSFSPIFDESEAKRCQKINIHFVGVGGVSVSSLAVWCLNRGYNVSGSDINFSPTIKNLIRLGLTFYPSHNKNNVINKDIIIYSSATENSCEVVYAKSLGKKVLPRAKALGELLKNYKYSICVAGAHGKTTTTALIYSILKCAQLLPSLHLGGTLLDINKNYNFSGKTYMVCEACEYKDSFLNFNPYIGVILNIAPEHLDYFKTFDNVKSSFIKFAKNCKIIVANASCGILGKNVITFGQNFGDYTAKNIVLRPDGKYEFDCYKFGSYYASIKLNLYGKHNVLNALASICVCDYLGVSVQYIKEGLANFCGIERRFQILNSNKFIVHDYAHHPDEIRSCITETLQFYHGKLLVIFQPHTYSRTKLLFNDFISCLNLVKNVVIYKTYSAREKYNYYGSGAYLYKNLKNKNKNYFNSKQKAIKFILEKQKQGYGLLFLGAGDIYELAKIVAKKC